MAGVCPITGFTGVEERAQGWGDPNPMVPPLGPNPTHQRRCHRTVRDVPELRTGGRIGVQVAPAPPPPAQSQPR